MQLIGFCGPARAGKNKAASAVKCLGWHPVAFADNVRKGLLALNPNVDAGPLLLEDMTILEKITFYAVGHHIMSLRGAVAMFGWEKTKSLPEVRGLLQRYGTDAGRDIHGADCWINNLKVDLGRLRRKGYGERFVATDVRFLNEIEYIRSTGGHVWWIDRDVVLSGEPAKHKSENTITPKMCCGVIPNRVSLPEFKELVRITVADWMA